MQPKGKIGEIYGHLTLLSDAKSETMFSKNGNRKWIRMAMCRCVCGVTKKLNIYKLTSGNTTSCGCKKAELTSANKKTHGMSKFKIYDVWIKMRDRCNNVKNKDFKHYGGRGIVVCERWNNSFENFLSDMGDRPTQNHTIERIDGNKNYCPENCKWIPAKDQPKNTSQNIIVKYNGESVKLLSLYDISPNSPDAVRNRIRSGWDIESALFAPINAKYKSIAKQKSTHA